MKNLHKSQAKTSRVVLLPESEPGRQMWGLGFQVRVVHLLICKQSSVVISFIPFYGLKYLIKSKDLTIKWLKVPLTGVV